MSGTLQDLIEWFDRLGRAAQQLTLILSTVPTPAGSTSTAAVTDDLLREQRRSGVINIGGQ